MIMTKEQMYHLISSVFSSAMACAFLVITVLMLMENQVEVGCVSALTAGIMILLVSLIRMKYED